MASLTVHNLEDDVRAKLQELAHRHGRTLEDEVRDILHEVARQKGGAKPPLGSRFAERFKEHGLNKEIPDQRGCHIVPPDFEG